MTGNVVTMPGLIDPEGYIPVQNELVEALEGLLEDAKSGRVVGFAYVAVSQHGLIRSDWGGSVSREMLGYGLSKLTHRYYDACLDD